MFQFVLALVLVLLLLFIEVWDITMLYLDSPKLTISAILFSWAIIWPIFPLWIGIFVGHVFWSRGK